MLIRTLKTRLEITLVTIYIYIVDILFHVIVTIKPKSMIVTIYCNAQECLNRTRTMLTVYFTWDKLFGVFTVSLENDINPTNFCISLWFSWTMAICNGLKKNIKSLFWFHLIHTLVSKTHYIIINDQIILSYQWNQWHTWTIHCRHSNKDIQRYIQYHLT